MNEEIQMRVMCLDFAIKAMDGVFEDWDDKRIVVLAQQFYEFLRGETK